MNIDEVKRLALRLPRSGTAKNLTVSLLAGGLTNQNYRVEADGESFVLRIPGESTQLLGIDRRNEAHNLRAKPSEGGSRRESALTEESGIDQAESGSAAKLISLAQLKFKPDALLELVGLVENKTISNSAAQQVFAEMFESGKSPAAIVQEKGLAQVSDTAAIEKFCDEVIAANPGSANDFKSGKAAALNFL